MLINHVIPMDRRQGGAAVGGVLADLASPVLARSPLVSSLSLRKHCHVCEDFAASPVNAGPPRLLSSPHHSLPLPLCCDSSLHQQQDTLCISSVYLFIPGLPTPERELLEGPASSPSRFSRNLFSKAFFHETVFQVNGNDSADVLLCV